MICFGGGGIEALPQHGRSGLRIEFGDIMIFYRDALINDGLRIFRPGLDHNLKITFGLFFQKIVQRSISLLLTILLSFGLVTSPVFANDKKTKMKNQVASCPIGSYVSVRLRDHRELRGRLSARGESSFQLEAPDPVSVAYSE